MIDWQIYRDNGTRVSGSGTSKQEAFSNGTPHAAAHVWIWKLENDGLYLLFQRPAPKVAYKAGLLDISAAGHVDIGEDEVTAALREAREELGIELQSSELYFAGCEHYQHHTDARHKNEFRFIYCVEFRESMNFVFEDGEVDGVEWIRADTAEDIVLREDFNERFVPHVAHYFEMVFFGVESQRKSVR